jgi:flavin-dependent trigonelline monooxygenase, reductase component
MSEPEVSPQAKMQSEWVAASDADPRALRNMFGVFMTGVTIVTMRDQDGVKRGFTANSFTSVSLDPPLVLVCVGNEASSHDALCRAERFGVNILGDWQREASMAFSSRTGKRFEAIETWASTAGGPPLITGSLATLDCAREQIVPAGDHSIIIGRVLGFSRSAGQPLGYYGGHYIAFGLGVEALERLGGEAIRVSCLLECRDKILLLRRANSSAWELPATPLRAGEDHRQVIPQLMSRLGVSAHVSFLYSVYQEAGDPHTTMVFRGVASHQQDEGTLADGTVLRLFAETEKPWRLAPGKSPPEAIRRFFRERAECRFGIYWDTNDGGRIASLQNSPVLWLKRREAGTPSEIGDT